MQTKAHVAALEFSQNTPLAYITQTTLSVDDTRAVVEALMRRYPRIIGPDTRDICYAVQNRQTAVRELSQCVDVVLVIGSTQSTTPEKDRPARDRESAGTRRTCSVPSS
ncbi:hypothetical protein [Pseudomonas mandelii]|uniref:hypothetical protein n=1 Tax=Pseudomonas mandelii TaxID=75612 RepID=UPI00209D16D4|nr:hypothetical protein [Pseudomonas mandelii]